MQNVYTPKGKDVTVFGYIMPRKPELRVREWNQYRAEYCGLCKELQRSYGLSSRMFLNYDLLLLALLYDSLHGCKPSFQQERCIAGPIKKRWVARESSGLFYAASCLVLLSHHKLRDDIADEAFFKKAGAQAADFTLHCAYQAARKKYPDLDSHLSACMQAQAALEADDCKDIDRAADPTAQMVAFMARGCAALPEQKPVLYRFGLFLGKIIYLLDAAEDFEKDEKHHRYNVFLKQGLDRSSMLQAATFQCKMAAAELSCSFHALNLSQDKDLLDNIIYLGLPSAVSHIGCEKQRSIKHDKPI